MAPMSAQQLAIVKRRLEEAERNLQLARQALQEQGDDSGAPLGESVGPRKATETDLDERVIHGVFDGEHMNGEDGQLYPVPANYASKSKLVEGDGLKLAIQPDGAFVYKQVKPIDRRRVRGVFGMDEQGRYTVTADGKAYRILLASVTFYHLEPGDEATILLPTDGEAQWGAVEFAMKAGHTA